VDTGDIHGGEIREGDGDDEQEDERGEDEEDCGDTEHTSHSRQLSGVSMSRWVGARRRRRRRRRGRRGRRGKNHLIPFLCPFEIGRGAPVMETSLSFESPITSRLDYRLGRAFGQDA